MLRFRRRRDPKGGASISTARELRVLTLAELRADGRATLLRELYGRGSTSPVEIYALDNVLLFGETAIAGYITKDTVDVVAESLLYPNRMREVAAEGLEAQADLEPKRHDPGSVCLLDMEWTDNIWHFLMECVPRVIALEDVGFDGRYLIADLHLHREVLRLLGIAHDRIEVRSYDPVLYRRLVITDEIIGCAIQQRPWLLSRMRERLTKPAQSLTQGTRLYIGRRGELRSVVNEAEVLDVLRPYGVRVVYMEDHSLEEQLRLASEAEVIIGPHGAGFVFAAFMRENGALIEFFGSRFVNPCMIPVCEVLGLSYHIVPSTVLTLDVHRPDERIKVERQLLELVVRQALGPPPSA